MDADWKQGHWMLNASYHVVGSDAGCMRCHTTMDPALGANLLSQVFFCFSLLYAETLLIHWAHGIKDTNTLDVVRDDYLFGCSNVQIQQVISIARKEGSGKSWERGLCGSGKGTL